MSWRADLCQTFRWSGLLGFHMNVAPAAMRPAMNVARVYPDSPSVVWCGDAGVPKTLPVYEPKTGLKIASSANPDWNAESPAFTTVFLLFVDEAEARALAPHLWNEEPAA